MSISGIGSNAFYPMQAAGNRPAQTSTGANAPAENTAAPAGPAVSSSAGADDPMQAFLDYMKETPAQQMEDKWLHAHGMSHQQFAAMSPADQQKIREQMQQDIELQAKQQMDSKTGGKLNIMA